jgi:hypothetical protein
MKNVNFKGSNFKREMTSKRNKGSKKGKKVKRKESMKVSIIQNRCL